MMTQCKVPLRPVAGVSTWKVISVPHSRFTIRPYSQVMVAAVDLHNAVERPVPASNIIVADTPKARTTPFRCLMPIPLIPSRRLAKTRIAATSRARGTSRAVGYLCSRGVGEGSGVILLIPNVNQCPFLDADEEVSAGPVYASPPGRMPSGS
jgi:hypothetical protein